MVTEKGECADGKGEGIIRELGNLEMRKWGGVRIGRCENWQIKKLVDW